VQDGSLEIERRWGGGEGGVRISKRITEVEVYKDSGVGVCGEGVESTSARALHYQEDFLGTWTYTLALCNLLTLSMTVTHHTNSNSALRSQLTPNPPDPPLQCFYPKVDFFRMIFAGFVRNRQIDRHTVRQTDRQTDRQTEVKN
jgi:hypothetical protein